jgi:hypothetical protein
MCFTPREGPLVPTVEARRASELVWTQRPEEKSFASAGNQILLIQFVVR